MTYPHNTTTESPFWGPKPEIGDTVYIDFGDSAQSHPEVTGTCYFIDDTFIGVGEKRFRIANCVHIEVIL